MTTTTKKATNSIIKKETGAVGEQAVSPTVILQNLLKENNKKLKAVLGDNASSFMVSLVNLYTTELNGAVPQTVLNAAFIAAALKLPIEKNLGFAYIVPYKSKGVMTAQFQLGYKGLVQLALRSGGVKKLNAIPVYEGQIKSFNPLTEEMEFDFTLAKQGQVVGYAAYMELVNGFNKTMYASKEEIREHALKFSKSYGYDVKENKNSSVWSTQFDEMALKTMIKRVLKFAPLSTDFRLMETVDQGVVHKVDVNETTGEIVVNQGDVNFSDNAQNVEVDVIVPKDKIDDLMSTSQTIGFDLLGEARKIGIDVTGSVTEDEFLKLQNLVDDKVAEKM